MLRDFLDDIRFWWSQRGAPLELRVRGPRFGPPHGIWAGHTFSEYLDHVFCRTVPWWVRRSSLYRDFYQEYLEGPIEDGDSAAGGFLIPPEFVLEFCHAIKDSWRAQTGMSDG